MPRLVFNPHFIINYWRSIRIRQINSANFMNLITKVSSDIQFARTSNTPNGSHHEPFLHIAFYLFLTKWEFSAFVELEDVGDTFSTQGEHGFKDSDFGESHHMDESFGKSKALSDETISGEERLDCFSGLLPNESYSYVFVGGFWLFFLLFTFFFVFFAN